jgi:hypothetical protein
VGTPPRRWLVAIIVLLGLLAAVLMAVAGRPGDRTFATLADPVQSLMSVAVPLLGVLLVQDLRRAPRPARLAPTLLAATLLAAAVGAFGVVLCAVALAVAAPGAGQDPWRHAGTIAVGSVLVQVLAQLVGTGLGLLLRSSLVAFLATIVLPLGLWFVLGGVDVLRPAQGWLTPYGTVPDLLAGRMGGPAWTRWLVVFLLWGVGLNAVGAGWRKRRRPAAGPAPEISSGR